MSYLISSQFLGLIEEALKTKNPKDIEKAIQTVSQTRELGKLEVPLNPIEVSKIWEQECPSILNFAETLLAKKNNSAWNELTLEEAESLVSQKIMDFRMTYHELIRNAIEVFKEKN